MNNLPKEFLERMQQMLGDQYLAFLASYDRPTRAGLRVNMLKKRPEDDARKDSAEAVLPAALFGTDPVPWAPNGYYCEPKTRPGKHPFHEAGVYYMQEPSAMAVAALSGIKPGMRVLDACAAPGTKTQQIAMLMNNQGEIIANELHAHRTKLIDELMERTGVSIVQSRSGDASVYDETQKESYDRVLLDVPCSGLGDLSHKPEIRWHLKPEDIDEITKIQAEILEANAPYVKQGGILVYSTCTLNRKENENRIRAFLKEHNEFELCEEHTFFPFVTKSDGFYCAKMLKKGETAQEK